MPKNFQISQYDEPLCTDGYLDVEVDGKTVRVGIERVHLEEDTGKSLHVGGATGRIHGAEYSLVDYNRAGIPLVEIVTKPIDRHRRATRPSSAAAYVTELRDLLRSLRRLRRADGGGLAALRREHLAGAARRRPWGTRTETKNVNSLRSVERAVSSRSSGRPPCSTPAAGSSRRPGTSTRTPAPPPPGRSKEEAQDYRYFPEPDLVPVAPARDWVEQIRAALPEAAGRASGPGCGPSGTCPTTGHGPRWPTPARSTWSRETVAAGASPADARKWWLGELARRANDAGIELTDAGHHPGPGRPGRRTGRRGHAQRPAGPRR